MDVRIFRDVGIVKANHNSLLDDLDGLGWANERHGDPKERGDKDGGEGERLHDDFFFMTQRSREQFAR